MKTIIIISLALVTTAAASAQKYSRHRFLSLEYWLQWVLVSALPIIHLFIVLIHIIGRRSIQDHQGWICRFPI